eukprot:maker-scaffold1003_size71949-snap-gene-0.10 protein:Tk00933 transcript:maker-scaffold1003_size71949-snap-gene-0.10-mRNA-1 annotation:"gamma-interferon-inducible lysosomal thiol reductase"
MNEVRLLKAQGVIFASTLVALAIVGAQSREAARVKLGVYYESLCPDSQNFFRDQFESTYSQLGQYLEVYFNPFGHATYNAKPEGGWTFDCQHGPAECYGNLIQACILDRIQDQDLRSQVVHCIMTTTNDETPWPDTNRQCIEEIPALNYDEIITCQSAMEGEDLLKDFGEITLALDPPSSWVPWILIDELYIEDDFEATQNNLKDLLCEKYLSDVPECQ